MGSIAGGVVWPSLNRKTDAQETAACAAEAAFDRYADSLYRYFTARCGNDPHLADDLMQQLWLQTRIGGAAVPAERLEAWLRTVAQNLLRNHWRKQARRPDSVPAADPALAAALAERLAQEALPEEWLARREAREQLLLAITQLPHEQQELIVEHYFQGRSQWELAQAQGVSARAVEGRLYRARTALREALRNLE